ncbi:MAG: sigma-E processing peptidase SpoIIGA [Oscillospiraceae bacterium]|nr:sigma-E processing peptidase SpoIIGA [Oscillospiraceae bacterium]
MSDVVYLDVLLAINLFVSYLLLVCSSFLAGVQTRKWRLLCGAILGGASSLFLFLPAAPWWLVLLEKLFCSALIVFAGFSFGSWRRFFRCFAAFFCVNFAFAGIMLALWLCIQPNGMFYQNGAVYFDVSLVSFVIFACVCYAIIRFAVFFLRRRHPNQNLCEVTIHILNHSITLSALYDSGNTLTDGFTGAPVIVVEYAALRTFLPPDLLGFFDDTKNLAQFDDHPWRGRLREIPFHALGQSGLLPAFRSDKAVVRFKNDTAVTNGAIVAVTGDSLSSGSYQVILQASMWMNRRKGGTLV